MRCVCIAAISVANRPSSALQSIFLQNSAAGGAQSSHTRTAAGAQRVRVRRPKPIITQAPVALSSAVNDRMNAGGSTAAAALSRAEEVIAQSTVLVIIPVDDAQNAN